VPPVQFHTRESAFADAAVLDFMTFHQVLAQPSLGMNLDLFQRQIGVPIVEVVDPAVQASVGISHDLVQRYRGQLPTRQCRQPRLDLLDRARSRTDIRVRFAGAAASIHPYREAQKVERLFSGVHNERLGVVEAQAKSVKDVAHRIQRFVSIFSAHHDKIIRVAHEVCLQIALQVPPLPYSVENVQVAIGQQR